MGKVKIMNRKKNIRVLSGCWLMGLLILLGGCINDFAEDTPNNLQKVSITLNLVTPGLNQTNTRAMSNEQESAIDAANIQILVFQQVGAEELFRYQATITRRQLPQVTIEVPTGASGDQYRLVVLANADPKAIDNGTPKAEALSKFLFDSTGKWNASSTNPTKIPMWGELNELIPITIDRSVNILLHRALARVDMGLQFDFNNPVSVDPDTLSPDADTETVLGLNNFKIKDIRVYRTRNQGYVATSSSNVVDNEVVTPLIPSTASFNDGAHATLAEADQNPLLYTLPAGADSYLREIYLPESVILNAQSNMDNVPCLVVGGYYGEGNTSEITYYRADFAVYNNGTVSSFKPILRNHRYVFDIKSVSSPGFPTPEQALNSITSTLRLEVLDWNEVPLNYNIRGNYFLQVREREIWMEALAQLGAPTNTYQLPFQTNLELDGQPGKQFNIQWSSSGDDESEFFNLEIDYTNKQFVFTAKNDNTGANSEPIRDVVTLTVEGMQLTIIVNQKAFNVAYNLVCESVTVNGRYREGVPLNYTNTITLQVTSANSLNGEGYIIRTIEKNGIVFNAEGTFANPTINNGVYYYTIQLDGSGTPVNEGGGDVLNSFDVDIISNSQNGASCSAHILMAYRTKRILTIGANAIYRNGYMLEDNTASRAFVDASVNFGTMQNSTVPMGENAQGNAFTIEVMTNGRGMTGETIQTEYLRNMLNNFKPDIILTGQAINYFTSGSSGTEVIELLSKFVDEGGVFIMCNEYYPVAASINAMVGKIMGYSVDGNSVGITNLLFEMKNNVDDLITNGPFGDMRGAYWGADGTIMFGFDKLPTSDIITYSTRTDNRVCMFRHTSKPFFYMGEGGFISNPQRYIGGAYQGSNIYYPFAIDASYRPIPRTNFTTSGTAIIRNSQIFGNILTWAVDYSDNHGIQYVEGEPIF